MAADVHDIVDAPEYPEIAIIIAPRCVASEIAPGHAGPVLLRETIRIAPDIANHTGPGLPDDQIPLAIVFDWLAFGVDYLGDHSRQRQRCRARLERHRSRRRRDHDGSGFGLPPGIDDRATLFSDHLVIPLP